MYNAEVCVLVERSIHLMEGTSAVEIVELNKCSDLTWIACGSWLCLPQGHSRAAVTPLRRSEVLNNIVLRV